MALTFVLGRAISQKESYLYDLAKQQLQQDDVETVYYLIPDHLKFESEVAMLKYFNKNQSQSGMIDLQVYSFNRLAWHLLQQTGTFSQTRLSETGLSMLVKHIIRDIEEDLTIFRGESHFEGFVQRVLQMLLEFRGGKIDPQSLRNINNQMDAQDLTQKLHDLSLIYEKFLDALDGKYLEKEDVLRLLIAELKQRDLSKTVIIINQLETFSAQELELVLTLIAHCQHVYLALTLDRPYMLNERPGNFDLFYQSGMTYHTIFNLVKTPEWGMIPVENILLDDVNETIAPPLIALERFWVNSQNGQSLPQKSTIPSTDEAIQVVQATTKQAEVEYIAATIRDLTRLRDFRYRDILVTARDVDAYKDVLQPIFQQEGIPYFMNERESMADHPFALFLNALLRLYKRHFRYEDMMSLLKTELFVPANYSDQDWRQMVDVMENVMLAYGYEGAYWLRDEPWQYARFDLDEISEPLDYDQQLEETANMVKNIIREALLPLFATFDEAETNLEAVQALYNFLVKQGIKERLLTWRDRDIENGQLDHSRKHEQVWNVFINLLDEFVEILGEQVWAVEECLAIFETGFEQGTYSSVPPTLDQVTVSPFTFSRVSRHKIVFLLGVNEEALPVTAEQSSILTDEDREMIAEELGDQQYLMPSTTALLAGEPFAAYRMFNAASEQLIITYSQKRDSGNDHYLSPYVQRIVDYFPSVTVNRLPLIEESLRQEHASAVLPLIGGFQSTLGKLIQAIRITRDYQQPLNPFWSGLYRYMMRSLSPAQERLLTSLSYKNVPKNISSTLAEQLYGTDMHLSISQLEQYFKDPYSHFLQYGLKLRERDTLELTPAESGSFYHDILDQLISYVITEGLDITELPAAKIHELAAEIAKDLLTKSRYKILTTTHQLAFIARMLQETVSEQLLVMQEQFRRSAMRPSKTEVLFGRLGSQTGIPGLSFDLSPQHTLHVRGKIDRIDQMVVEDQHHLQVVDYKSSRKSLDYSQLEAGLMLQMLTYFDVALTHSQALFGQAHRPMSAFYAHVYSPWLNYTDLLNQSAEEAWLKAFKYDGLIVNYPDVFGQFEQTLAPKVGSLIYPIKLNADGTPSKRSKIITPTELKLMFQHNRSLIQQAGKAIISGQIELRPYKDQYADSAPGGKFHSISLFDALLPENNYRYLENLSKEEYIQKLQTIYEQLQGDDNDESIS